MITLDALRADLDPALASSFVKHTNPLPLATLQELLR